MTASRPPWQYPAGDNGVMPMSADLGTVEDRSFVITNFRLQNGVVMAEAKIAYETYGRLAADGREGVDAA